MALSLPNQEPPGVDLMQTEAREAALPAVLYASGAGSTAAIDHVDRPLRVVPDVISDLVPTVPLLASPIQLAMKRTLDIVGASLLFLAVLPFFVVSTIGVRLSSHGPILFRQTRVGRDGKPFTIFKFRTFPVDHKPPAAEHVGDAVVPEHQSTLYWGHLLRRTSIDELPQLLNVIRGDMSLVGPRPERPELALALSHQVPDYAERHRMAAGITGLAQIKGLVGDTSITERIAADNAYIDGWHIGRDIKILVMTIPAVIKKIHW